MPSELLTRFFNSLLKFLVYRRNEEEEEQEVVERIQKGEDGAHYRADFCCGEKDRK